MTKITSLCVFCGSKNGDDPAHKAAAERLGELMAERGVRLVYGGGSIGLMGHCRTPCFQAAARSPHFPSFYYAPPIKGG